MVNLFSSLFTIWKIFNLAWLLTYRCNLNNNLIVIIRFSVFYCFLRACILQCGRNAAIELEHDHLYECGFYLNRSPRAKRKIVRSTWKIAIQSTFLGYQWPVDFSNTTRALQLNTAVISLQGKRSINFNELFQMWWNQTRNWQVDE